MMIRIGITVLALSLSLAACSDNSSTTSDAQAPRCDTTQEVQEALLGPRCATSGCHTGQAPAADLDLAAPGLEARLIGASSSQCAAQVMIVPGDAESSLLYRKVADATPACGQRMPVGGMLSADELACVRTWIDGLTVLPVDAAPVDAAPVDAAPDASLPDAAPDASLPDASVIDASPDAPDASLPDASLPDASLPDAFSCGPGQTDCNGTCVDTSSDEQNCGACGTVCGTDSPFCEAGTCGCGPAVSFSSQVQPIFTARCTGGACHDNVTPTANLDLTAGRAHAELVDVNSGQCTTVKLVAPGLVSQSYLMNKLLGMDMCLGVRMPRGSTPLTASQLDLVSGWICHGALNN